MNLPMDHPLLNVLNQHQSVRAYRSDPVPEEMLESILHAAMRSATSSNLQMGSVVVVWEDARRHALATLCGDQRHIREAPVFLAWCADRNRLDRVCALQGMSQDTEWVESFLVAAVDAAIMMQSATVAAEALGLGCCYIGAIRNNPEEVIGVLELPAHVFPIAGMTLGYGVQSPGEAPLRPRLSLDTFVHYERYRTVSDDELHRYDRVMQETGIYRGRKMAGSSLPEEEYGWLEHSALRVRQESRKTLRGVLEHQGFPLR